MNQEGEEVAANAADNELDPLSGVRSMDKCSNNKRSQPTCQGQLAQRLTSCKLHAPGKLGDSTSSSQASGEDGESPLVMTTSLKKSQHHIVWT